jgi:uncharacterized protein with PQ loop repeat
MNIGEILSLSFAICNMVIWLFVLIPQIYINYKRKSGDAISILLLVFLFWGGVLSMTAAILKQTSSTVIYIGIHHMIMNITFISQVVYYQYKAKIHYNLIEYLLIITSSIFCISLILVAIYIPDTNIQNILVTSIAWGASMFFCISKLPQIILNFKRKSIEGLAISTFGLIMITNLCFIISVLINTLDGHSIIYLIKLNFQWLFSSIVSLLCDFIIIFQFIKYRHSIFGYQQINTEEPSDHINQDILENIY